MLPRPLHPPPHRPPPLGGGPGAPPRRHRLGQDLRRRPRHGIRPRRPRHHGIPHRPGALRRGRDRNTRVGEGGEAVRANGAAGEVGAVERRPDPCIALVPGGERHNPPGGGHLQDQHGEADRRRPLRSRPAGAAYLTSKQILSYLWNLITKIRRSGLIGRRDSSNKIKSALVCLRAGGDHIGDGAVGGGGEGGAAGH